MSIKYIKIESFLDKIAKLQNWEEVMNQCKQLFQFEFESKPLSKCFLLRMAVKQVYDWLNEYSVRIDGYYQKLFDILLESASTDIIMSILHRYEIRYWNTKNIMKKKLLP